MLDQSNRKPSKIWVVKGNEFYNRSGIEMYSMHNEEKNALEP